MKNVAIERLRGLAILLVLFEHYPLGNIMPSWFTGQLGVDLFFVISGYVVWLSLMRKLEGAGGGLVRGLGVFYLRRLARIGPMAVVGCAVCVLCAWRYSGANPVFFASASEVIGQAVDALTLTLNIRMPGMGEINLVHYWSLNVEEHFYLVAPWLLLALRRRGWRVPALCYAVAIVMAARLLAQISPDPVVTWKTLNYVTWFRCDGLLLGVLLAETIGANGSAVRIPRLLQGRAAVAAVQVAALAILAVVLRVIPAPFDWRIGPSLATVAAGALVAIAALDRDVVFSSPGVSGALEHLGARSYSLYLLNPILGRVLGIWFGSTLWDPAAPVIALALPLDLLAAELGFRLVERPINELARRRTGGG